MKPILLWGEGGGEEDGNPLSLYETVLPSLKIICSLNPAPTILQELSGSTFPSPWRQELEAPGPGQQVKSHGLGMEQRLTT